MAALAADRLTETRAGESFAYDVEAGKKIFAGSLVVLNADGHAEPGKAAAGLVCVGRAEARADNTGGADGDVTATCRRGAFLWENDVSAGGKIKAADVGKKAYVLDDQTVTKTATSRSAAGTVVQVDDDGVWVRTD